MTIRTLACPLPAGINSLSPAGYMFSIQKLPELTYFCQQVSLPAINLGNSEFMNPLVRVPVPGDTLDFEPLRLEFVVDTAMVNYKAVYNWLTGIGYPEDNVQFTNFKSQQTFQTTDVTSMVSDATLTILDNNNNPTTTVIFKDCYPLSIESLTFSSTIDDVQVMIGAATFAYTIYTLE